MHKLPFALLLLVALSVVSCQHASDSRTSFQTSVDSIFDDIFPDDEPGAIVLVAKGDSIYYNRGFGLADLKEEIPMTDTTLVNICSLSKQFSAVALLKLEEDSILSLEDDIVKYVPTLRGGQQYHKVKLKHLLSHTSGLPDMRPRTEEDWEVYTRDHYTRFASCRDFKLYGLANESTKYLTTMDSLNFEPGTAFAYENPPYQLIYRVIETSTGRRFMPWMEENVFRGNGLDHTHYYDPSVDHGQFSHAYRPAPDDGNPYDNYRSDDDRWEEYDYGEADFFATKPDGGVYTTALDFYKWQRDLFGGKVLGEAALKKAITPVIETDEPGISVAMGFFIKEQPGKPKKIYHNGANGGYKAAGVYMPEKDIYYLVFANRPDWNRKAALDALDAVLAAHNWLDE